jgi:glycosyltransferase involved in cell wall biosynthesis
MKLRERNRGGQARIAYLANSYPEPLEAYVGEEIDALRKRGAGVLACAMRRPEDRGRQDVAPAASPAQWTWESELAGARYVFPLRFNYCLRASLWFALHLFTIRDFLWRAVHGPEPVSHKLRALAHTWLGVYLARKLRRERIDHIHVHHGYYAAWVGMVAARILNAGFSLTLHGSDLLVRPRYLDLKLKNCRFCITVSEFNREFIRENYPSVNAQKVLVQPLGVDPLEWRPRPEAGRAEEFRLLTVGRLHPVKNQSFLLLACRALKSAGVRFQCLIAGGGPEQQRLQDLIGELDLRSEVTLLGHIPRERLPELYADAHAVVLTSHSEGVPVTLMEAMAMERLVIAPAITGIPELVVPGQTGFLYQRNSLDDLVARLRFLAERRSRLGAIRSSARRHIEQHFNRQANLASYATQFLGHVNRAAQRPADLIEVEAHEDPVLQQI